MIRIACFAYVSQDGGSSAGANFLILKELLDRGYQIDFFGWEGFNQPIGLSDRPNLKLINLANKSFVRPLIKKYLPERLHNWFDNNISAVIQNFYSNWRDQRTLYTTIRSEHQKRPYDLVLFLDLYSTLRLKGVPAISWVQGPPQTEWNHIKALKQKIVQLCGVFTYYKLGLFYLIKNRKLASELKNTDIFICGSQWSKEQMINYGLKPESVKVISYPLDLQKFEVNLPKRTLPNNRNKVFLWLGRIDPRKRFDLLMDAYSLVLAERQDVHLKIVGNFRYAKGYKQLIDSFQFPNHVEYCSSVQRQDVPDLIRSCDILVQPSEGENFGFSVAEALCCGVPVLLGSTNGTKDYISASSFVFQEYTPEALKQTMLKALEVLETAPETLALDARKAAERSFSIAKVVDDLELVFQEALVSSVTVSAQTRNFALEKAS